MEKRKRIAVIAVIFALIAAGITFIPIKRQISQDFTCYACHQDDPDYQEELPSTSPELMWTIFF